MERLRDVPEESARSAGLARLVGPVGAASAVLVGIPALNEARFIGSVVLQARDYGAPVLVVDDGSSDGTAAIAERAGAEVIRHRHNRGKGAALNTIFDHARHRGAQALVVLDGDG